MKPEDKTPLPADEGRIEPGVGRLVPERWSVWIEGGGSPGRWMTDVDFGSPLWSGSLVEAEAAAAERNRVHGPRGLSYSVRETPNGPLEGRGPQK